MKALDTSEWQTLSGDRDVDIREKLEKYCNDKRYTLHVGTDTQPHCDHTVLITAICFREQGKGAFGFFQKRRLPRFNSVLERLLQEATISIEVAEEVRELTGSRATVHADVNPDAQNLSNRVTDVIVGMVKGMGYDVLIKPDSWASDIADMYTK
tara:strand:+ start:4315 stop:4776 length:462 start_codon:yes stop_codon:yes gene_type:complete